MNKNKLYRHYYTHNQVFKYNTTLRWCHNGVHSKPGVSDVIAVLSTVKVSTIIHEVILWIPSTPLSLLHMHSGVMLGVGAALDSNDVALDVGEIIGPVVEGLGCLTDVDVGVDMVGSIQMKRWQMYIAT